MRIEIPAISADALTKIIRVAAVLVVVYAGWAVLQGYHILQSHEGGFSAAGPEEVQPVAGNAIVATIASILIARPHLLTNIIGGLLGTGSLATSASYIGTIGIFYQQYKSAPNDTVRKSAKAAIIGIVEEMCPEPVEAVVAVVADTSKPGGAT